LEVIHIFQEVFEGSSTLYGIFQYRKTNKYQFMMLLLVKLTLWR